MSMSETARRKHLKNASADLSRDVGGIEASADLLDKSKSVVGRNVNKNDDCFFNLFDAAELESHASEPFITKAMARLAGGVFIQLPESSLDSSGLREQVLAIAEELGDVSHAAREALKDSHVDAAEGDVIARELDQLIERAVQTRAMVQAMSGKPVSVKAA